VKKRGNSVNALRQRYREQAQRQITAEDRASVRCGKQEQGGEDALGAAAPVPGYDCRVCIRLVVYQTRSFDVDNSEAKSIVDALVANGVLAGDSVKEVPLFIKQGEICKTVEEERTVVEIYEA